VAVVLPSSQTETRPNHHTAIPPYPIPHLVEREDRSSDPREVVLGRHLHLVQRCRDLDKTSKSAKHMKQRQMPASANVREQEKSGRSQKDWAFRCVSLHATSTSSTMPYPLLPSLDSFPSRRRTCLFSMGMSSLSLKLSIIFVTWSPPNTLVASVTSREDDHHKR